MTSRVVALLIIFLAVAPSPVHSEPDDSEEEARRYFELGVAEYQEGRYEQARAYYEQSYELVQNPRTLFNLAASEEKLELYAQAYEHYRSFLVIAEPRDEALRPRAERRVVELGRLLAASVEIVSDPPGASVFVDGASTTAGKTPVTLKLPPGKHNLALRLEGRQPEERQLLTPPEGELREEFELSPILATLLVRSSVGGAEVLVDGESIGAAHADRPLERQLPAGSISLVTRKPGYSPLRREIDLRPRHTVEVSASLEPRRSPWRRIGAWGLFGLGAASVAGGVAVGSSALDQESLPKALFADGLYLAGAASLIGGVLLYLGGSDGSSSASVQSLPPPPER